MPTRRRTITIPLAHPFLLAALLAAGGGHALAGERPIEVAEPLGVSWTDQMLQYRLTFRKGICHEESLTLVGPDGPAAVQVSQIEAWPGDGSVKTATVSFVVDRLAPLERRAYTLSFSPKRTDATRPASDLTIVRNQGDGGEQVTVRTSQFGFVANLGERKFDPPAPPDRLPGPIQTLILADGTRFGGGRLYGPKQIRTYRSELLAAGPVFAEVKVRYEYEDATTSEVRMHLAAGQGQMMFDTEVQPVDPAKIQEELARGGERGDLLHPEDSELQNGWQLLLTPGLDGLTLIAIPEFYDNKWGEHVYERGHWRADPVNVLLADEPAGHVCDLVPWTDWWCDTTKVSWELTTPQRGPTLAVTSRDAGVWVEPAPLGTWTSWGNLHAKKKWLPLVRNRQGDVFFLANSVPGKRRWQIGPPLPKRASQSEEWRVPESGHVLNRILNEYVLDWPEPKRHPRMFLSPEQLEAVWRRPRTAEQQAEIDRQIALSTGKRSTRPHRTDNDALSTYLRTGDAEIARQAQLPERLRDHLALLGNYDRMRLPGIVVALYDALIDTELVAPEERRLYRAQLAYLGYTQASPRNWSMERGYCSGNQNMTVAHVMHLGRIACAIPNHPLAEEWVGPAEAMMEKWLASSVGPAGEWPESVSNYANVSASFMLTFAIAARNAGFRNFVDDPRMKRLLTFLAKQYTPPDPRGIDTTSRDGAQRLAGYRALPPSGRAGAGGRWALSGVMARATAETDPEYSRHQQWLFRESGFPTTCSLDGFTDVYLDPTLPAEAPNWTSDLFPREGFIFRHGFATAHEWYVKFCAMGFGWESENGSLAAFWAKGVPIQCRFAGGYAEREELFVSRPLPARPRGDKEYRWQHFYHSGPYAIEAFAALPRQDYGMISQTIQKPVYKSLEDSGHQQMKPLPEWPPVAKEAKLPVHWRRQALLLKGDDPAGASWLLLRDNMSGGQPTMWQFWCISKKIGTAEEAADREAFLADAPGEKASPARELKGDRLTAVGQFGVDTEFFIAAPVDTPRHTLRWGTEYHYVPLNGFREYQDLLHLQLPEDGAYYVAIFPRRTGEAVPLFRRLAGGRVVEVSGSFGTDYGFLAAEPTEAVDGDVAFAGTAGSIQRRTDSLVLALAAKGAVRYGAWKLEAAAPVSVIHTPGELLVTRGSSEGSLAVQLTAGSPENAPCRWRLATDSAATLRHDAGTLNVTLAEGMRQVRLVVPSTPQPKP